MCKSNITFNGIAVVFAAVSIVLSAVALNSHLWIEGCQSIAALERTKVAHNINSNETVINPLLQNFDFCINLGLFHIQITIPVLQQATKYAVPVASIRHEIRGTAAFLIAGILLMAVSLISGGILTYYAMRVSKASKAMNDKFVKVSLGSSVAGAICFVIALLLFTISLYELANDSEQFIQEVGSATAFLLPGIPSPTTNSTEATTQHPHVIAFQMGFKTNFGYGFFMGWATIPIAIIASLFFAYLHHIVLNPGFGDQDVQMDKVNFNKI